MKINLSSFMFLFVLITIVAGCGTGEARRSTDGADAQAIQEYEDAIAVMEKQDTDSDLGSAVEE